jgi:hypothetical protein
MSPEGLCHEGLVHRVVLIGGSGTLKDDTQTRLGGTHCNPSYAEMGESWDSQPGKS